MTAASPRKGSLRNAPPSNNAHMVNPDHELLFEFSHYYTLGLSFSEARELNLIIRGEREGRLDPGAAQSWAMDLIRNRREHWNRVDPPMLINDIEYRWDEDQDPTTL